MKKKLTIPKITLGVCYYPEQWPESLWADDFGRMREMGLSVVRLAEFAWSIFEPEEGKFEFDLFDRVMDLGQEHQIRVILCTPTATPPAWLTHKYPETLNVNQAGVAYRHGQRRHYNYNSPVYRDLSERIASKLAEHYAPHPALIGWQIDNELNCEVNVFYSEADQIAFRDWLQAKYGLLDALNDAWGAVFWNQTYSAWEQVRLTGTIPSDGFNPHQALDEKRFISDSVISYAKLQAKAIRAHDPSHFITTNGLFGHLDSHRMTEEALDFISYDSYPLFAELWPDGGEEPLLDRAGSGNLSAARDISPNFCVMEQQAGPGGWVNRLALPTPKPGQLRLWAYQSIAHGADLLLFFRWRTATFGTEIYWHGINDYHNEPNRRCAEIAQFGAEIAKIGEEIAGARNVAEVAIVRDYDNTWDGELDVWHGPYTAQSETAWKQALQRMHVPHDVLMIRPQTTADDLGRYNCLIYPHPAILPDAVADVLKAYVHEGGTVVFGCRTGYKDEQGQCPMRPFPGAVADLCGIAVEDFTRIGASQKEPSIVWRGGLARHGQLSSGPFNDILRIENERAEIVAMYGQDAGHYARKPALVENAWGRGLAYYFGGVFTTSVARALAAELGLSSPAAEVVTLPPEVELVIREQENGVQYLFLLNYTGSVQHVDVHRAATDMLTGAGIEGPRTIPAYGVMVLRVAKAPVREPLERRERELSGAEATGLPTNPRKVEAVAGEHIRQSVAGPPRAAGAEA